MTRKLLKCAGWVMLAALSVFGITCLAYGCNAFGREQTVKAAQESSDQISAGPAAEVDVDKITSQVTTTVSNQLWPILLGGVTWIGFDMVKTVLVVYLIVRFRYLSEKRKWNKLCGKAHENPADGEC